MTTAPEQFTIKGRFGDFEYGYIGRCRWIVRDRQSGETIDAARDIAGAVLVASRAYLARKAAVQS